MTKEETHIMKFFGALKEKDWNAREKEMKKLRNEFEKKIGS